jgi:signal transduction histidine kinase
MRALRASSPTRNLLLGLAITLFAVAGSAWYALRQIHGLRELQNNVVDRNRKDSLQLLRIQNNLHALALALRDMVEGIEPYPLEAWESQFSRIRFDLEDALRLERSMGHLPAGSRDPEQLTRSLSQFWNSSDQMFALARAGQENQARELIRTSLESQQASLTSLVAQLLILNNDAEKRAQTAIQSIYDGSERNIYLFLVAMMLLILATSFYLIQANRSIFARMAALSNQRRVLARKLIGVQEEILHSVSRELHDEFGQILTAIGALLGRAQQKGLPPDSSFRHDVEEVRGIVQSALETLRSLSHALHPTILDDYGLDKALEWYTNQFGKQSGIVIRYEKHGTGPGVGQQAAIHVYRIVQEALTNVARHSRSKEAWVRLEMKPELLRVEVEDHGIGLPPIREGNPEGGLGLVAMKERAEILHGKLDFRKSASGGTLVVLQVPLAAAPVR